MTSDQPSDRETDLEEGAETDAAATHGINNQGAVFVESMHVDKDGEIHVEGTYRRYQLLDQPDQDQETEPEHDPDLDGFFDGSRSSPDKDREHDYE